VARFGLTKVGIPVVLIFAVVALAAFSLFRKSCDGDSRIGMVVEFMDHAAAAYVAQYKGWFKAQGLKLSSYTSYVTGMALASALARRDIQVGYMCLIPAINAYANASVSIKIVSGTHRYGYALVVNPEILTRVEDLTKDDVRVGCVREGGAVDLLMNRTLDKHRLDRSKILHKVRRMNPSKLLLAIKSRQLDAAFLPEQWASMAEDLGFNMLVTAQDVWPKMQGSVLVVKEELIRKDPGWVRKLVDVNEKATQWINTHPVEAADTLARVLSITGGHVMPSPMASLRSTLEMSSQTMLRSMGRLEYTTSISHDDVQEVIDYAAKLGYIKKSFPAGEIMDTRFMP
jgi:NitT/TauT family transport system substrate-binding protein